MPINNKESLIYTALMCPFMVFVMSAYNIAFEVGLSPTIFNIAWGGLPLALITAFLLDRFVISNFAKQLAFKYVTPTTPKLHITILVSSLIVVGMVFFMSFYGAIMHAGFSEKLLPLWGLGILRNIIFALPFQLLIAGPVVRKIFRKLFPIGTVIA